MFFSLWLDHWFSAGRSTTTRGSTCHFQKSKSRFSFLNPAWLQLCIIQLPDLLEISCLQLVFNKNFVTSFVSNKILRKTSACKQVTPIQSNSGNMKKRSDIKFTGLRSYICCFLYFLYSNRQTGNCPPTILLTQYIFCPIWSKALLV